MQGATYFRNLTNAGLDFAIKDILEARDLLGKDNLKAHDKYQTQLSFALEEKRRRQTKNCCPTCNRPLP